MYLKTIIFLYIAILLSESCVCSLVCPPNITSFAIGSHETQYYICKGEGRTPLLQTCPDDQFYWPVKGKCSTMSARNSGKSDLSTFSAPVLGNQVYLGCFYDARRHEIMEAYSFWDRGTVINHTVKSHSYSQNIEFFAASTTFDRLNHMDIDVALQLEFLGGLIHVEGSASFLRDSVESEKTVAVVMKAHYSTRSEMLPIATPLDYNKFCKLKGPTHVVTALTYGMDANFVYKKTAKNDEHVQHVAGSLKIAVKSLPSIKIEGSGRANISESLKKIIDNIDVKLFGDFVLDEQPTTYEESLKVFKQLSSHLGTKPEYENAAKMHMKLTPITEFCDEKTAILISISDNLVHTVAKMLDELERSKLKAKTLLMSDSVKNYLPLKTILDKFLNELGIFELGVKGELQTLLPNIRGGGQGSSEKDLVAMFTKYRVSPFYFQTSETFLKVRAREIKMIDFMLDSSRFKGTEVNVLNFEEATDDKILYTKPYITMVRFNILPPTDIIDRFLKNNTIDESKSWFNDNKVISVMGRQFRDFMDFVSANSHAENKGFLFALYNANMDYTNVFAQREGEIISSHFEFPRSPPQMVSTSNTYNAIYFAIGKPDNKWVTGFTVQYWQFAREESQSTEVSFKFSNTSITTIKISGLTPNEIYQFSMKYDTVMGHSPPGRNSAFIVTRPCSPPVNLYVKNVMATSFDLYWDGPLHIGTGIDIKGYEVVVQGDEFTKRYKLTSEERHIPVKGTHPASMFTVTVVAVVKPPIFNESSHITGISNSLPANVNVVSAPHALTAPNLVAVSFHSAEITWNAPGKIASGATIKEYLVKYVIMDNLGKDKYSGTDIVHSSGTSRNIEIKDLVEGTTYGISVKVVTSLGESEYSAELIIKTKFKQTELDQLRDSVKKEITSIVKEEGDKIDQKMKKERSKVDKEMEGMKKMIMIDCDKPVFYPPGSTTHQAQSCYKFEGATVKFVGYFEMTGDNVHGRITTSIRHCASICYEKMKEDPTWDGMEYHLYAYCRCYKNGRIRSSDNTYLYYKLA